MALQSRGSTGLGVAGRRIREVHGGDLACGWDQSTLCGCGVQQALASPPVDMFIMRMRTRGHTSAHVGIDGALYGKC